MTMLENLTDEQRQAFLSSLVYAELRLDCAADRLKQAEQAAADHGAEGQRVLAEQAAELEKLKARHAAQLAAEIEALQRTQQPARDRLDEKRCRLDDEVAAAQAAHQEAHAVFTERQTDT